MEPIERELRDAMRAEVDGTQSSDALDTILARTRPANRRGALGARRWFVVGGASLAAAATITAVVLLAEGTLSTSSRPKPPVSSTVTHQDVTVAVYYTGPGADLTSPPTTGCTSSGAPSPAPAASGSTPCTRCSRCHPRTRTTTTCGRP